MYISKKKTYKILAYAMSAIFVGTINGGVAFAYSEEDEVEPSDYNNKVEVTEDTITRNGTAETYNGTTNRVDGEEVTSGNANNNVVIVSGGKIINFLNGGYSRSSGDTNYNFVKIDGGTFGSTVSNAGISGEQYWVEGGWAVTGDANSNRVIINGGTFNNTIIDGGYTWTGNTNKNKVIINGGEFKDTGLFNDSGIFGGYVAGSGNAIGNEITIKGGTFSGNIYGGYIGGSGTVEDNVVNIYGSPDLSQASIFVARGGSPSNNTLKIRTTNLTVKDIGGFENLNFYLPASIANDENKIVLTVTNPTKKISNYIRVYKDENLTLNDDTTITLLTTTDETTGLILGEVKPTAENDSDYSKITKVPVSSENPNIIKSLTINAKDITQITPAEENEITDEEKQETKIFNEPIADSVSLLDSGTDRILEWLPPEGVDYMNSSPTAGFDPFIGIGGSSLKIDTGNGTKLKTKNGGINFGMTRYLKNRHGIFIIAPLVDYGQDSYESTLPDENQTHGSGNSRYFTAGLIARQVSVNGMYYEASIRGGKIKTDFHSDNFLVYGKPTTASYEVSTPCYSGHVRIGWRNHISPQNILDVYGVYSMNRIKGFTTKVSTGEDYSFSSVNSGRIRLGARFTRELKERESVYSSIAFIHEFTGETVGEYMGMSTPRASLKGSAGLIELGWQIKPAKNSVAMLDTSLSLWVGDRKGFTFATKFKKDF